MPLISSHVVRACALLGALLAVSISTAGSVSATGKPCVLFAAAVATSPSNVSNTSTLSSTPTSSLTVTPSSTIPPTRTRTTTPTTAATPTLSPSATSTQPPTPTTSHIATPTVSFSATVAASLSTTPGHTATSLTLPLSFSQSAVLTRTASASATRLLTGTLTPASTVSAAPTSTLSHSSTRPPSTSQSLVLTRSFSGTTSKSLAVTVTPEITLTTIPTATQTYTSTRTSSVSVSLFPTATLSTLATSTVSVSHSSLPTATATHAISDTFSASVTQPATSTTSATISHPLTASLSLLLSTTKSLPVTASLSGTKTAFITGSPSLLITRSATVSVTRSGSFSGRAGVTFTGTASSSVTASQTLTSSHGRGSLSLSKSVPVTTTVSITSSDGRRTFSDSVSLSVTRSASVTSSHGRGTLSDSESLSTTITGTLTQSHGRGTLSDSESLSTTISRSITSTDGRGTLSESESLSFTLTQTLTSSHGRGTLSRSKSISETETMSVSATGGPGGTLSGSLSISVTRSVSVSVSAGTFSATATLQPTASFSVTSTLSESLQALSLLEAGHTLLFSPFFQNLDFQSKRVVMRRPPSVAHLPLSRRFRVLFSDDIMMQVYRTATLFDYVDYADGRRCRAEDFDTRWGSFSTAACRQPLTCWQTRIPRRNPYTFHLEFGPASRAASCAPDNLMAEGNVVIRGRFAPGSVYYGEVRLLPLTAVIPAGARYNSTVLLRNDTESISGESVRLSHTTQFWEESPGLTPGSVQLCEIDDILAFNGYGGVGNGETYACQWTDPLDGSQRACRSTTEYQTTCTNDLECVGFSVGLNSLAFAVIPPYVVTEEPLFLHRGDETYMPDANITRFKYGPAIQGHVFYAKPGRVNRTCTYGVKQEPQKVTVMLAQTSFRESFAQVFYVNTLGQRQLAAECGGKLPFAPRDATGRPLFGENDRCDEFVLCAVSPTLPVNYTVEVLAGPLLDQRGCGSAVRALIQSTPVGGANGTAEAAPVRFFPTTKHSSVALPLVSTTASISRTAVVLREATTLQLDVLQTAFLGTHATPAASAKLNPAHFYVRINTTHPVTPLVPATALKLPSSSASPNTTVVSVSDLFGLSAAVVAALPATDGALECGGSKTFGGGFPGLGGQCEATLSCGTRPVEMSQAALAAFAPALSVAQRAVLAALVLPEVVTNETTSSAAITVFYSGAVVVNVDLGFMRGGFPLFTLPNACVRFKASIAATQLPHDSIEFTFSNTTGGVSVFPLAGSQPLVAVTAGADFTPTNGDLQSHETLMLAQFGPDAKDVHYDNASLEDAFDNRMATVTTLPSGELVDSNANKSFMCVRDATTGSTDTCRIPVPFGANHVTVRIAQIDMASNDVTVRFLPSPGAGASRTVQCGGSHGFQSVSGKAGECGLHLTCTATFIDGNTTGVLELELPFGHVAPIATTTLPPVGQALGAQCAFAFVASVDFAQRPLPSTTITTKDECQQQRQGLFCEDERACLSLDYVCDGRGNDCASGRDEEKCAHFLLVKRNTTLQTDQATVLRTIDQTMNPMDCRRHAVVWAAEGFVYRSQAHRCDLYGADAVRLTIQNPDALMAVGDFADLYLLLEGGPFAFRKCTAELHCSDFGKLMNPEAPPGDECVCECNADRAGSDCGQSRAIGVAVSMYALVDTNVTIVPAVLADALSLGMRAVSVLILGTSLFNESLAAVQFAPSSSDAEAMARHQALMWSTAGGPGPALTQINTVLASLWQPSVRGLFNADGHHAFGAFAQCSTTGPLTLNCSVPQPRPAQQLLVRTQGVFEFTVTVTLTAASQSASPAQETKTASCSVSGGTAVLDGTGDCAATSCVLTDVAVAGYNTAAVTILAATASACSSASAAVLATSDATLLSLSVGTAPTPAPASGAARRSFAAQATAAASAYVALPEDFIVTETLNSGLFSAAMGIGAVMLLTMIAVVVVAVLMSRAFRAARVVVRGTNALAMKYLPSWVKVTLVNERVNQSSARMMVYIVLGITAGIIMVGTLAGFFSVLYVKSSTASVGVAVALDVYSTEHCGGSGGAKAFLTTFPTRATSFPAVGTCAALAFTGLSEDTLVGKGTCFSDGRILLALSRTPTGCENAEMMSVERGRCLPLRSLGLGASDPSVAYAVVDCVSTALARDHVAGLHTVNPTDSLHTVVVPSSPREIDQTVAVSAADGSTVRVTPYRTGRVPGQATSHDKNTIASVHSAAYIAGPPNTDRMVFQTADTFLPVPSQTHNAGRSPTSTSVPATAAPADSSASQAASSSSAVNETNVTFSLPAAQSTAAAMSLTSQHAVRIGTPLLAVVANGGAGNATVQAIAAATAIDPPGIAADTKDLPVGHLFGGYGTSLQLQGAAAGSGAQRYFHVEATDFDVGSVARSGGVDGAITLQAWVRATETTRGVAVGIVDHLENTVTKSSPVIEQMLLAVAAGDAASALWYSSTWRVYSALLLDGPARQVTYVFAEPNATQRVVMAQWQLDELDREEVFTSHEWHHIAVVVSRGLGKPYVRLYIDGHTILNSQLWRKCLPRDPPKVAPLPSAVRITGAIETQQAVATHGGVVYVGYGNLGVDAVSVRDKSSDTGYFTRRGTRAMRVRNAMQSPSLLALAAASFVGAMACFVALVLCIRTIKLQARRLRTARRIGARRTFDENKERLFSKQFQPLSYAATRQVLELQDGDEFTLFMNELIDEPTDAEGSSKLVHCLWLASGGDGPCTPELWASRVVRHADDVMLSLGKEEVVGGEITLDDDAAAAEASLGAGSGAAVELPPQLFAVFLSVLTTLQSLGTYMVSWDLPSSFGWVKSVIRIFTFDWLLNLADSPLTTPIVLLFVTLVTLALLAFILARDVQRFRSHLLRYQFVRDRAEGVASGLRDRALGVLLAAVDTSFFQPGPPKATPKLHTTKDPRDGCHLDALRCPLHSDRVLIPREQDKVFPFHGRYRCCVVVHKKKNDVAAAAAAVDAYVAAHPEVSGSGDAVEAFGVSDSTDLPPTPNNAVVMRGRRESKFYRRLSSALPSAIPDELVASHRKSLPLGLPPAMQALLKDKEKEKSEPRTRQRSVMLPEMSEDLKARAEHQQSLTSPPSNKSPDDPLAGTIALSTSNMSSDGGADIVPPGSKEGPLQEAPAPAPVPAQDVVAVNETEASEAWRRARKSVDGAAHRESTDGVFVERFVFANQEDQDAKAHDDEGDEERCGTSKPFNRAARTSNGSRMRASTSTTDARGDKIARCGDDQCLLLTCPQCDYAVCSAHARAPTYRRVLNDLWMLGRAYILHGWVWFAEFIVLNVAISIYMPVLRTCVMIIGCHPQFQCVFPHCWRKVEQDYAAAVYLAAVVGVVFGIGFPFTLYFLIKGRIGVLLDVFGSVSYGGAFMAPFDKITPVVKSDEAEFEFAADGEAGNAAARRQSSSVGAAPAVFSSGIDFHLPNVEETVSNDPMDVSGRSGVTPSSTPRSAAAAGKYLTGPPQPPQAVGLTVSVSDPMELSRSRSSHGQSQSQNHSRSSFLSQQQLSSPGQQALPSQQSQRRSRTRSIMSRHEAETAALELYTAGMPDCLRREIRKTGGIHGDHYDRSAAHWARDFVVRPKLAWAMWRKSKSATKHEAKSGQRHLTSHDKKHGSGLADNLSDLGGSSELTPMSMSRRSTRRSTRRGSMAEAKYLSPEPKAISPSGDQLVAFVDAADPPSRGESGELKRSRRSISVVVESVGTTPNRRSSLSTPGPLVFPQRIPSRHVDDDDEDEDLFVGRQDPGVEAHGGDLSSVEGVDHDDNADPDGDVRPEEQEETGGQDEEAEDAAEDQDELEDTETPFSLDFPAQTDAQAGTTEGADESRTAAEEEYSDPSGHPDSAQPETYVEAQSMELFDGKDHVVGAASGVINVDLLYGPSFFDDDEETFQAIDDVCAAAIAAAEAEPLDVEDERCTVDDNTPRATPTASATASTPRTLLSPLMSPGRARTKAPPKSFEALRSKIDTKAKAPLRAPPKKAPTPGSPRRVASPLGAKGTPKPKPKAKAPAKSPAGKAGSPRAPSPKATKAVKGVKGPFAAESWALTPRATAKSAAWRGARGRAASPRRGAPERSSRSPPARQVDFSPIDVDLVEAEEAQTVDKSTLRPRRMTTILAPDTDTESERGGGEALDRAPPSPAFGAAALPRPEDIPAPESPTAKPEPLSFSRSHRRSTFRGSVLLGGSHMGRSRRSSHHSHSGLDHHHDHHDHVHGNDNDDEVFDQYEEEEEDCAARAPPDSIVGDVISLSLAERAQLRTRREEAEFPTRWLEVLHGIENVDTRRDMAARRIQEFWLRDRPVLALQRVIIETVLEYKAAIVLQRLYKSMLQRKLIAAIKRQAAMAKSHVVLTGEWLRFAKCDASILALVYQQLHFDRITTVPALLCGKFLFVIPTLLLEPQSVGQFVAVCFGEMIYAALFAAFDPYLSPWVTVITLLGSVQQLLLIAAQICVVAVRNDIDISQLTGYAMAGLTLCYFSSIAALLAYMIIQPAMRTNRVEAAVTNLFERFGLLRPQAEETYRYKYLQGYKDIPGLEVDFRQQSHHWAIVPPKAAEDSAVDGIEITTGDEGPVKEELPVDFSLGEEGAP